MNFGFTEEPELLRAEVRTFLDPNSPAAESGHDGIRCLRVEMDTPGIPVRPSENLSGDGTPNLQSRIIAERVLGMSRN